MERKQKKESVFMQMHNGKRTGEGSFNVALAELFYKAGTGNRRKLVEAFPEFFGDEVPEFGIMKRTAREDLPSGSQIIIGNGNVQIGGTANKSFKYRGWLCKWDDREQMYFVYTPDEAEQPIGYRCSEFECATKKQCREFIDTYQSF
jgi:hypothetical protein